MHRLQLHGVLLEREALRFTPGGVPVCQALIAHESVQIEAGGERQVKLHLAARVVGDLARQLAAEPLGKPLAFEGFLAHRRLSREGQPGGPILYHVTAYRIA